MLKKKYNGNPVNDPKNRQIICYKLNKELNNVIWGKDDDDNDINYKEIKNFFKINYLIIMKYPYLNIKIGIIIIVLL